jgi:hypothetical protein
VQRLLKELLTALDEAYHRSAEVRDLQSRRLFHVKDQEGSESANPGFMAAWPWCMARGPASAAKRTEFYALACGPAFVRTRRFGLLPPSYG